MKLFPLDRVLLQAYWLIIESKMRLHGTQSTLQFADAMWQSDACVVRPATIKPEGTNAYSLGHERPGG